MHIDPAQQAGALAVIDRLMQEVKGIKAVVVSAEDGFEIASRTENTAQVARLSAVASSLAALGAVAGEESQLGACDSIVVEAENGQIVMVQARGEVLDLIVSVVTGRDAIIGQVLYFTKQAALTLQRS